MDVDYKIKQYCRKGHSMKWSQGYLNNACVFCKSSNFNYSRWMCEKCNEKYCVGCKLPQVFEDKCPLNHQMVFKDLFSNTCDACRKSIKGKGYRDATCDFDLCQKCMMTIIKED